MRDFKIIFYFLIGILSVINLLAPINCFAQPPLPSAYTGINLNYVRTWDATAPIQDGNTLSTKPLKDIKVSTQYFDGLGRPLQTVIKGGSLSTGNAPTDMVSTVFYDEFGREQIKYLPYPETTDQTGNFKTSPFSAQATFYNSYLTDQIGESNPVSDGSNWAFNQTNFEPSPINQVTESFAPGVSWAGTAGQALEANRHSVKAKYFVNTAVDQVRIWNVDNQTLGTFGVYSSVGNYNPGELFKNITIDENNKQVIEFKDKAGKVILKKVQLTAPNDDGSGSNYLNWLCTYYIYDNLNNLRCVIQPNGVELLFSGASNSWNPSVLDENFLKEQCFRYEYDYRNRMIMKRVPGAAEVKMVYDNKDRLVMTQDGNMGNAIPKKWLVTKYDNFNRPIETVLWENADLLITHISNAKVSTGDYPVVSGNYEIQTTTHYDNYSGLPTGLSDYLLTWNSYFSATNNQIWPYPQMPKKSTSIKGMVT